MSNARKLCIPGLALLLAAAVPVHGQPSTSPAAAGYYRVSGVSEGGVLNVRAAPGVSNPKVGTLAPGESPIEVVDVRAAARGAPWGLVATREGAGWVSMRYLERIELEGIGDSVVPRQVRCAGTEPFWGLSFEGDTATFDDPSEPRTSLPVEAVTAASGRVYPVLVSFAGGRGHALFDRRVCSDGMSDIPHGWSLRLILTSDERRSAPTFLSGCCRVRRDGAGAQRP